MDIIKYQFKTIYDERGALAVIEGEKDIPFQIKRIYYVYNVEKGLVRGKHAHKTLQQILICIHGSCKILLEDGDTKATVLLDKKSEGLYMGPYIWREMYDFSKDAVLVILASEYYTPEDYIYEYDAFLKALQARAKEGENNV